MRDLILGLLSKESTHGYELKTQIDDALGRLWPSINDGQIYVTLKRLEKQGLVASETVDQPDRPKKQVYGLTARGREHLDEWFQTTFVEQNLRDAFFLQLVTALEVPGGPDPIGLIDRQRRALLRRIREVQLLEEEAEKLTERIAIERSLLHLQAEVSWLEECETALAERGEDS